MQLVDVHAHLDHPKFEKDLDKVIERAEKAGVKAIIVNGINKESNRATLELAKKYSIIKPALGVYPVESLQKEAEQEGYVVKPFSVEEELRFIEQHGKELIAIGEIGLDDYTVKGSLGKQLELFRKQIDIAKKFNLPVIIHSRKAEEMVIEALEQMEMKKVVMHAFGGKKRLVKRVVENKWFFSIPPIIERATHFQMIVELTPLSQLFTETDAPYLAPTLGQRNEPAFVAETIKQIAKIKKTTEKDTALAIFQNYQRLFL